MSKKVWYFFHVNCILSQITTFAIGRADTVQRYRYEPSKKPMAGSGRAYILGENVLEAYRMNNRITKIVELVFKAVALAMGVAVVVMNILGVMDAKGQVLLLGIGLFCLAITALDKE
jgi:hypothetical protein